MDNTGARPPRNIVATQWIWVAVTLVTLFSASLLVLVASDELGWLVWLFAGLTLVQAGLALPAAVALRRGARWARRVLLVLGVLSIAAVAQGLQSGAWPSISVNLLAVATVVLLNQPDAKAHCTPRPTTPAADVDVDAYGA